MQTWYKNDMITEIKSLIQLEMEKVVKRQEEKFNGTVLSSRSA